MANASIFRALGLLCIFMSFLPYTSASRTPRTSDQTLNGLFPRGLTCANPSLTSCASVDPKLPGDFCCSTGTSCISLDSSSTALCCPAGAGNCTSIQPISCNLTLQNPSLSPGASVQTTKLTDSLPVCGSNCCPFGYTCNTTGSGTNLKSFCLINEDTSIIRSNPGSSSTTPTLSTASSTATSASGIDSNQTPRATQCPKFPGGAVAAGFFPGLLAGALLMLLGVLFFGSRRAESRPSSHNSSIYKPRYPLRSADGTIHGVSGPIEADSHGARTDFLHRTTSRAKSFFSRNETAQNDSVYSSPENWKMPTPPAQNNIPMEPVGRLVPVTPQAPTKRARQVKNVPSTESIRVYSPHEMPGPDVPIAPLRKMEQQRHEPPPSKIGSPFKTPPINKYTYPEDDLPDRGETLTPARYNDGVQRDKVATGDMSRPVTTFTDMLSGINFPDPARERMPKVPAIPQAVDWSRRI